MIRTGLCALLLLTGMVSGFARVEIIDGNNGLSNSIVTSILKDRRGLMWIGTRNGLNIYDGYTFTKPFRELANLSVTHLGYDDRRNIVWAGTDRGLFAVFVLYGVVRHLDEDAEWNSQEITALSVMPGQSIYAAYKNGIIVAIDSLYERHIITRLKTKDDYHPFYAQDIIYDTDNSLIIGTQEEKGMFRLHMNSGRLDTIKINGQKVMPGFIKQYGDTIMIGQPAGRVQLIDKKTWTDCTPEVIRRLNTQAGVYVQAEKFGDILYATYVYGSYGYTDHYRIHLRDETITTAYKRDFDVDKGWRYNNCIFKDEYGIIWIGTESGIVKMTEERSLFERELYNVNKQYRASVRAIIEDETGDLYVGSYTGLYHYSKKEQRWHTYHFAQNGNPNLIPAPFALMNDTNGYVYIAGRFPPFYRFHKKKKIIETDFYDRKLLNRNLRGYTLFRDAEGLIWLGSNRGLLTFDPVRHTLVHHQHDRFDIGNCIVRQIQGGQDKDILWIATDKGLFRLHRERGITDHYRAGSVPDLSNNDIYFVEEDTTGQLWLGTNGGGINIISRDRQQIRYLDKGRHGLANDIVYGMLHQNNGNIWISTFNGLSCYDPEKETFTNYYTTDGLSHNDFNRNSFFQDRNGKMYFGGVNGINTFYPDSLMSLENPAPRLFVSPVVRWSSQPHMLPVMNDLRGDGDRITLSAPNTSLVFNLGLSDYTAPAYNTFSFRIPGLFDEWTPLPGPVLRLNGIPYGDFTVEIRAANVRGVPAVNTLNFHLLVKRPFHKTWWFYALLLVSAAILIFVFFLVKYRNLKNMQRLRLSIASNLHDEVGTLLTGITLFSDNLRFSGNTGKEKDNRLEKIASLSREATNTMSDILWAIDVRNDFSGNLEERMREHAEDLFLHTNVMLHIDFGESRLHQKVAAEFRQQLYLIFKEALNNILKHARPAHVYIIYQYRDQDCFLLRITNDGVTGEPVASSGQGLKNMKMRAGRIGADMQYDITSGEFVVIVSKNVVT